MLAVTSLGGTDAIGVAGASDGEDLEDDGRAPLLGAGHDNERGADGSAVSTVSTGSAVSAGSAGSAGAASSGASKAHLGIVPVMAIAWFTVSGGPWGSEGIVAAGGPRVALASLLVFPLLFSLPQALITAELSTAFCHNGGYSHWVSAAFGEFWAVQVRLLATD